MLPDLTARQRAWEWAMNRAATRIAGLTEMLIERRRQLQDDVYGRIREGRAGRSADGDDDLEQSEADTQTDIGLALLQLRAATLARIDEALGRLDAGTYGTCADCGRDIAARRLRALPFAVRCQACEEQREAEDGRARHLAVERGGLPFARDGFNS
jgi:DnaK suppressor protein